ncbi:2741_t:CDS:2, partial [Gigaspora rosea]
MDFKIEKYNENFMSFRTPARYTYNIDVPQNVYRVQPIPKKRTRKRLLKKSFIEAFDPYYAAGKSCDVMQDQGCISKSELNDLINEYLEDFDNLIPKSRKDEPCILGNYNRNGIVVPALKKPS